MKTNCRTVLACFAAGLAGLLVRPAHADMIIYPTLSYFSINPISSLPSGEDVVGLRLTGYVFTTADLDSLTSSEIEHYTITSLSETGFEAEGGTVINVIGLTPPSSSGADDGDTDWVYSGDLTVKAHPMPPSGSMSAPAVPEDPLPPSDPRQPLDFEILYSPNGKDITPANVPYTLTSEDGSPLGTIVPDQPFVPSPAPEPSQVGMLALLGVGFGGLVLRARRRRAC